MSFCKEKSKQNDIFYFPNMPKEFKTGRYQHYKGNYYIALDTVKHSETEEQLVLYKPETSDQLWVRPLDMFLEEIEIDGKKRPRFLFLSSL